jgi:GntR family transcriptional regulator
MFELDLRSRKPVYEQLVEKIIELIISNVLKPDQQLPSVRVLSAELTINPNTIQKAYRELEHRGFIYSLPGKGSFVRPAVYTDNPARISSLKTQLSRVISEMLYLGVSKDEIIGSIQNSLSTAGGGKIDD